MKQSAFVILFLTAFSFCFVQSFNGQETVKQNDIKIPPIEIIANEIHDGGLSKIKGRDIYIYIDEQYFNLPNVRKVFEKYQTLFPEPYILNINLYSSKEMLQRLIRFNKMPIAIDFSDTEEGRKAAAEFYGKYYPLQQGYFRAEYSRYGDFELFDYSPRKNHPQMVRTTIKSQANRLLSMNLEKAIFEAVITGDIEATEKILSKKVNPDVKDKNGSTPIILASASGHIEIIKLLVKAGANLHARTNTEVSALEMACIYEMYDSAKTLIDLGFDVNSRSKAGATAIIGAAIYGNQEIVSLLIKSGADVKAKTNFGVTALMAADDDKILVETFLKAGVKIDDVNEDGWTALFYAVSNFQPEKLKALLENGANVNLKDKKGQTPLMLAEQIEKPEQREIIIKILKQFGAG